MADITKNAHATRWEAPEAGEVVGHLAYHEHGGVVSLTHTEVPPEHGGRGIAGQLVEKALDAIRDAGQQVRPVCPYVAKWIDRHPAYADLVHTEWS